MKKYMVFGYTNIDTFNKEEEPSKEERQKIMQAWMDWKDELGELLVTMGSPLINGKVIHSEGVLLEKPSNLSGYMIIRANHADHAIELLNKSPLFGKGHGQKYELFECIM